MSARVVSLSVVVVAAAVAAVIWIKRPGDEPVVKPPEPPPVEAPAKPEAPVVMTFAAPTAVRDPSADDKRRMFRLPNGDYVPSLNGVLDAPAMQWPDHVPFSPIVGRERDGRGQEWYVHADGSKSTNSMVYRSDLGRMDASTQLANPTAAVPMDPDSLEKVRQQQAGNAPGRK